MNMNLNINPNTKVNLIQTRPIVTRMAPNPPLTITTGSMFYSILGLLIAIAIPVGGGFLSGYYGMRITTIPTKTKKSKQSPSEDAWYASLKKPAWNPPAWVFGPVWTVLYLLMGISSYIVWANGGGFLPLFFYALQLIVNFAWSPTFFGFKRPDIALILLVTLWFLVIVTMALFSRVSITAMLLLIPYILWITYALSLNAYIVHKNTFPSPSPSSSPSSSSSSGTTSSSRPNTTTDEQNIV